MGSLTLPVTGSIYVDAQIVIYSTDQHPVYGVLCSHLWERPAEIVSSDLILLETLVGPLKQGDAVLAANRESIWLQPNTRLLPITHPVLREAARLRAAVSGLKTPDAIHAATALLAGCALFVTNDHALRQLPGLTVAVLDDILAAP